MAMPAFETYVTSRQSHGRADRHGSARAPTTRFRSTTCSRRSRRSTRLVYVNNPNNPTGQPVSKDAIRRVARAAPACRGFRGRGVSRLHGRELSRRGARLPERARRPHVLEGAWPGRHACRRHDRAARAARADPVRHAALQSQRRRGAGACARRWRTRRSRRGMSRRPPSRSSVLYAVLDRVGLRYWKSAANFVLVDGGGRARELVDGMIARGVLVRDRSKDPYCPNCFRITAGVVEHTQKAVEALEALCAKP